MLQPRSLTLALARHARRSWVPPLLIGLLFSIIYELLRSWLRRKPRPAAPAAIESKEFKRPKRPPQRPGVDRDERFEQVEDDPRYFPGAELGKAQRAALGEVFHSSFNTASFSPSSTLVEPSLRLICPEFGSKNFTETAGPDDIIAVPDFFCPPGEMDIYESILGELRRMVQGDSTSIPEYEQIIASMEQFFSTANSSTCITWHEKPGAPSLIVKASDYDAVMASGDFACAVHAVFGSSCELQFQRPGKREDLIAVKCVNGSLHVFGSAALARYHCTRVSPAEPVLSIIMLATPAALQKRWSRSRRAGLKPNEIPTSLELRDPLHRPAMRIRVLRPTASLGQISHDDVIVIPEFACRAEDWDSYYTLLKEIRAAQSEREQSTWDSWHEGAHLLTKNPNCSKTFREVLSQICDRFSIATDGHLGTRFNWYRDSSDWKPFHHDSAAFNPSMAKKQNCTVGVSFGASRELAFKHVASGSLLYFPQTNGMLFFFGRDVNIRWQHGINAVPREQQSSKGRISIISWGLCELTFEEFQSPPMLEDRNADKGKSKGKGMNERRQLEGFSQGKGKGWQRPRN